MKSLNQNTFSLGWFLKSFVLIILVLLWILPTIGLFVSSFRDKDQLAITGWWNSF